jgi:hypothetical protein
LQLSEFPAGRVTATTTDPNGIPKSAFIAIGADGNGSLMFQTQLNDQPGIGRYTFRFDEGTLSLTTHIDVTRPAQ